MSPSIVRNIVNFITTKIDNVGAKVATGVGTAFDTKDYEGNARIIVHVGAVSGTSPTLDLKIQSSATSGGTYADVTALNGNPAQIVAADQVVYIDIDLDASQRFIKVSWTLGGTSPSFAIDSSFTGLKKY